MATRPIPEGFHTITPFFMVRDVKAVITFAKKAFDAKQEYLLEHSNGKVMHAQIRIGDSNIMLGDAMRNDALPSMVYLYTDDVDGLYRRAIEARGKSLQEPTDMFYGDRSGGVKDPQGISWWTATHVEDVSEEELKKRGKEFEAKAQQGDRSMAR
jgi:uncharacterized glyoxalase superfamily protein PhnB